MQIRVGYELIYQCPQWTPMVLTLNIHYSRASDMRSFARVRSRSIPRKGVRCSSSTSR